MLNDAVCFKRIYIVTGYTDLRFGIDSLAALIESKLGGKPFVPDTLYLFCGRRTDRIKGLVWESDGYLLLYKPLEQGNFQWPRSESDVRQPFAATIPFIKRIIYSNNNTVLVTVVLFIHR